jgi:hypothetical protein
MITFRTYPSPMAAITRAEGVSPENKKANPNSFRTFGLPKDHSARANAGLRVSGIQERFLEVCYVRP